MPVHSIISNTISEEILLTGHLSIRFMTDGYSLLLEDKLYKPVLLNSYREESEFSLNSYLLSCEEWLDRQSFLELFKGEVTIVVDEIPSEIIPDQLFSEKNAHLYLEHAAHITSFDFIKYKPIKNRPFHIVYELPVPILDFGNRFPGKVRYMSPSEVILSMADHVNASEHQRGFGLIEIQKGFMAVLIVKNDQLVILNHLEIKTQEEIIYNTLNTLEQLHFDRKKSPLYFAGTINNNELNTLSKYIRNISPLSYHIQNIEKSSILEHVVLAEATRCE